jgi:2-aminoethylphosphonate-pyruvate transaminase
MAAQLRGHWAGLSKSSDEVFVKTQNGHLVGMSKSRDDLGNEISGEMVGICKISRSLFSVMLDTARQRFGTTCHVDYECPFQNWRLDRSFIL